MATDQFGNQIVPGTPSPTIGKSANITPSSVNPSSVGSGAGTPMSQSAFMSALSAPLSGSRYGAINNPNANPYLSKVVDALGTGAASIGNYMGPGQNQNFSWADPTGTKNQVSQLGLLGPDGKPIKGLEGIQVTPGPNGQYQISFQDPGSEGTVQMTVQSNPQTGKLEAISDPGQQVNWQGGQAGGGFGRALTGAVKGLAPVVLAGLGGAGLAGAFGGAGAEAGAALGTDAGATGLASLPSSVLSPAAAFGTGGGSIATDAALAAGSAASGTAAADAAMGGLGGYSGTLAPGVGGGGGFAAPSSVAPSASAAGAPPVPATQGGWNPSMTASNTFGAPTTDVSAGTTGALPGSTAAPSSVAAPGASASSTLPGAAPGAGLDTAGATGLPVDPNAFQPTYGTAVGSSGTGAAGGASAAAAGGGASGAAAPSMLDKATSGLGSLGTKALNYLGTGNNAMQAGSLALGAYSMMTAAQKQQSAQSMGQQIQALGIPLTTASNSLLQQYANGTLTPADQFAIQQYVQSNIAQAKDYYAKAGLGDSSMMQSAMQTIQQQGEAMRSAALSSYLQNATSLATAGNAQQTTGINAQIAADNNLQNSQQALLQALATMTAGTNKQAPTTASTAPATTTGP